MPAPDLRPHLGRFTFWKYRRYHISLLIGLGCFGALGGLLVGRNLGFVPPLVLVVLAGIGLIFVAWKRPNYVGCIAVLLAGLFFGTWRGAEYAAELEGYDQFVSKMIRLEGVAADDPTDISGGSKRFALSGIKVCAQRLPGEVYVTLYGAQDVKRGDRVALKGKLAEGFGSYAASTEYCSLRVASSSGFGTDS